MQKSIIEKLVDYFLDNVAYTSFILSKEKPFLRKIIKMSFPTISLLSLLFSIYLTTTGRPPQFFILPILFLVVLTLPLQRFFEKRSGYKVKDGDEVKSRRLNVLKNYLKENQLLKNKIIKFMIHQIALNKPAKQVSPIGFALLFTFGIYFSDPLSDGLLLYTDMFRKNTVSIAEREFWISVSSVTYTLSIVFMLYMVDRLRVLFLNRKFEEVANLVKMLEDIYITKLREK